MKKKVVCPFWNKWQSFLTTLSLTRYTLYINCTEFTTNVGSLKFFARRELIIASSILVCGIFYHTGCLNFKTVFHKKWSTDNFIRTASLTLSWTLCFLTLTLLPFLRGSDRYRTYFPSSQCMYILTSSENRKENALYMLKTVWIR